MNKEPLKKNYLISSIQYERYEYVLRILSDVEIPDTHSVYIYGTGKQSKSFYEELKRSKEVEVIWFDYILTGFLKLFSSFIAAYAGLVKIKNMKTIQKNFNLISESSMAGIYIIDKLIESPFINEVKNKNSNVFIVNDLVINNSNNYFIYLIDNDALDSETGIYEIKSIGENSPIKGF